MVMKVFPRSFLPFTSGKRGGSALARRSHPWAPVHGDLRSKRYTQRPARISSTVTGKIRGKDGHRLRRDIRDSKGRILCSSLRVGSDSGNDWVQQGDIRKHRYHSASGTILLAGLSFGNQLHLSNEALRDELKL
jgi:hypothetical protein